MVASAKEPIIMIDQPIPFTVVDLPISYRVRVATPSLELRKFVVPRNSVQVFSGPPVPEEAPSGLRLKVA